MRVLSASLRRREQLIEFDIKLCCDSEKHQHRRIVHTAFYAADHIRMYAGLICKRLLAQIQLLAPFAQFFTEAT